jgi:hypothetical protein
MFSLFPDYHSYALSKRATEDNDPGNGYTVGKDNDGRTVVKITHNGSTITMFLNEEGVCTLIRLLEATLPIEEESSGHD